MRIISFQLSLDPSPWTRDELPKMDYHKSGTIDAKVQRVQHSRRKKEQIQTEAGIFKYSNRQQILKGINP